MPFTEDPTEFIDVNEFGDVYTFEGKEVEAVVDDHDVEGAEYDGVMVHRRTMTVAASQLAAVPVPGQSVKLDGLPYTVEPPVKNQGGIAEITMARFVS